MQIGPIPIFFDTWDVRAPKTDSVGNPENLLENKISSGKKIFPAENRNLQRKRQISAGNLKN